MAFSRAGLSRIGGGNTAAPTLWTYSSDDALAVIEGASYFDNASKEFNPFDVIICMNNVDGTPTIDIEFVLTISAAGVVAVGATAISGA